MCDAYNFSLEIPFIKEKLFDIYFSKDNLWTTMLFSSARLCVIDQQAQLIFALSPVVNAVISWYS